MNSTQDQINQASYTLQTADILDGNARINLLPSDCNFYENTMPDLIDNYFSATGAKFNPLQPYSTTLTGHAVYKPCTLQYEVSSNGIVPPMGTASVTINATLYEPLVTPFTNISADDSRAL